MKDTSYRPLERNDQRKAAKDIPQTMLGYNVTRVSTYGYGECLPEKIGDVNRHFVLIEMEPRALGVDGRTREARAKRATTPPPQAASTEGAGQ